MLSGKNDQKITFQVTNVTPKRSLGQNFLANPGMQKKVVDKMNELINLFPNNKILEIGPGTGFLTKHLVKFQKPILAMEIDGRAVEVLRAEFSGEPLLQIVEQDALDQVNTGSEILQNFQPFTLLSNLPFNVGSRILVDLAINFSTTNFSVILQKEVAQKLVTKDITFFGAWCRLFWDCKLDFSIAKNNFSPAPKVDAALVTAINLLKENTPEKWLYNLNLEEKKILCESLKKLFVHPRKSLKNNLLNLGWSKLEIDQFMTEAKLAENARLDFANYKNIIKSVYFFGRNRKSYV
jgi:16S rRNA (adenine1518-N6/adenine1519-N6)-dimethyltransferase